MRKLALVALTLVGLLAAIAASAQAPQINRPERELNPLPQRIFPPRGNGAFACYADAGTPLGSFNSPIPSLTGRDLSGSVSSYFRMTNDLCRTTCSSKGFLFAGTQSGSFCFCGNSVGTHGTSNTCNVGCSGYPGEVC